MSHPAGTILEGFMTQMLIALIAAAALVLPAVAAAQNATIEDAAKALGAPAVKTLEITGGGYTVHLSAHIAKLGLAVDQHVPLHGRIVPFADLDKAIGRGN